MTASLLHLEKLNYLRWKVQFFAGKGPTYYYTYGRWRFGNWLQKVTDYSFDIDKNGLLNAIDLEKSTVSQVKEAVSSGNNISVSEKLTLYFQDRVDPVFFFEDKGIQALESLVPPDQKETTLRAATEICRNTFSFRGVSVTFEDGIDWTHRPQGNLDWTWDLNRHAYFETLGRAYRYTGNKQYLQKFRELLLDWLERNPAQLTQPNWHSVFEVAFRINTWVWAFYYFRSAFDHKLCSVLLQGLLIHGRYLSHNLEHHSANNHLLLEAKALAFLGILFPEFKEAKQWRQVGLQIFYQQIQAQVHPDGVHGEQATHYHRVITSELLELLILLENNNISYPAEVKETFSQMVEFELWITKPDGSFPLLGDSALADTFMRFSATSGGVAFLDRADLKAVAPPMDEATIWLLGPQRVRHYINLSTQDFCFNSRAFSDGGYFVMRAGANSLAAYMAFDCGPFCYKPVPGHGHADALSFELYAFGQTLLVDPGIYSTSLGQEWRNFFRGSRAHNTVVVDNQDQSVLRGIWRVFRPAQPTLHHWFTNEQCDFVDGSHSGYERLPEPITHRRQVFFVKPEYWIVIDVLTGQGQHCFDLYFHLMPDTEPHLDQQTKSLHTGNETEPGLQITPLATANLQAEIITGATAPIQGWVSFFSGEKLPAPTLRYRQKNVAPTQFCTILYPYPAARPVLTSVSPLEIKIEQQQVEGNRLTGLCIETDEHIDYFVVDREDKLRLKSFAGYQTDAQLVYIRHKKQSDELVKVITQGGNRLLFQGQTLPKTKAIPLAQVN